VNNLVTLSTTAIILYFTAAVSQLYPPHKLAISSKQLLLGLGIMAATLHAIVLDQTLLTPIGINLGFFKAASLVAWVIVVLLLLTMLRQPVENLLIVILPIAALTIGIEEYFQSYQILPLAYSQFGVTLHIFSSILAYSFLSISAVQALFLAYQDYQLHHKHPGWVMQRLPPLRVMENLLFQIIGIGFTLLSVSLASGLVFLEDIFAQHLVHKTVLSIIAWIVFAILLWGHWFYGWRGRTAIRWNLSGFLVLMLAYFGTKLVLELILKRG